MCLNIRLWLYLSLNVADLSAVIPADISSRNGPVMFCWLYSWLCIDILRRLIMELIWSKTVKELCGSSLLVVESGRDLKHLMAVLVVLRCRYRRRIKDTLILLLIPSSETQIRLHWCWSDHLQGARDLSCPHTIHMKNIPLAIYKHHLLIFLRFHSERMSWHVTILVLLLMLLLLVMIIIYVQDLLLRREVVKVLLLLLFCCSSLDQLKAWESLFIAVLRGNVLLTALHE